MIIDSGRAFSLSQEKNKTKRKSIKKEKSSIGIKASAAEGGKYTREAGVLAYYEVNFNLDNSNITSF